MKIIKHYPEQLTPKQVLVLRDTTHLPISSRLQVQQVSFLAMIPRQLFEQFTSWTWWLES
jgi:hypothetical protein